MNVVQKLQLMLFACRDTSRRTEGVLGVSTRPPFFDSGSKGAASGSIKDHARQSSGRCDSRERERERERRKSCTTQSP